MNDENDIPRIEPRTDKILEALRKKGAILKARIVQNERELKAIEAAIDALDSGNRQLKGLTKRVKDIVAALTLTEFTIKDIGPLVEPGMKTPAYTSVVASALKRMEAKGILERVGLKNGEHGKLIIWRKRTET